MSFFFYSFAFKSQKFGQVVGKKINFAEMCICVSADFRNSAYCISDSVDELVCYMSPEHIAARHFSHAKLGDD